MNHVSTEDTEFRRAISANYRYCLRNGSRGDQPSEHLTETYFEPRSGCRYVVLNNVNGVIANYRFNDRGRLQRVAGLPA